MTAAERQFFHEMARIFTGAATMASSLAVNCQTADRGPSASPEEAEANLRPYLDALKEIGASLRARREAIRTAAPTVAA